MILVVLLFNIQFHTVKCFGAFFNIYTLHTDKYTGNTVSSTLVLHYSKIILIWVSKQFANCILITPGGISLYTCGVLRKPIRCLSGWILDPGSKNIRFWSKLTFYTYNILCLFFLKKHIIPLRNYIIIKPEKGASTLRLHVLMLVKYLLSDCNCNMFYVYVCEK